MELRQELRQMMIEEPPDTSNWVDPEDEQLEFLEQLKQKERLRAIEIAETHKCPGGCRCGIEIANRIRKGEPDEQRI